jgi:ACS family hexuronate transporter-like MFS transporter
MSGLSGTGAGLGGVLFTLTTGWLVDRVSYTPVFLIAGTLPILGFLALTTLVGTVEPIRLGDDTPGQPSRRHR